MNYERITFFDTKFSASGDQSGNSNGIRTGMEREIDAIKQNEHTNFKTSVESMNFTNKDKHCYMKICSGKNYQVSFLFIIAKNNCNYK